MSCRTLCGSRRPSTVTTARCGSSSDYAEALHNRGDVLQDLRRLEEALESCDRALRIRPDYADALHSRGDTLLALGRVGEALDSYERASTIVPEHVNALTSRGDVLHDLKRLDEALDSYGRALNANPDLNICMGPGCIQR